MSKFLLFLFITLLLYSCNNEAAHKDASDKPAVNKPDTLWLVTKDSVYADSFKAQQLLKLKTAQKLELIKAVAEFIRFHTHSH